MREPHTLPLVPEEELGEARWLPALAVVTAALLYATLPGRYVAGSTLLVNTIRWFVVGVTVALIVPLALTAPTRKLVHSVPRRTAAIALIAVISAANGASIVVLVHLLVTGHKVNGHELIIAAIHIWCTNVIAFALWFWQLDSGGPVARRRKTGVPPDFLFPQQAAPEFAPPNWQPTFLDYLYLSFTNATAFSPTDTMPFTRWAKMLMLAESGASLLLLVMVAARAVNILH
ncbi:MAG: hypothetical protein WAQ33_13700 [Gaiellaceae bacterium]